MAKIRASPMPAGALRVLMGYRGTFPTLQDAEAAVRPYANGGHVYPANGEWHVESGERARPSDYAALFHLQTRLVDLSRVFDFGGNLGNLFYCYARYLAFRPDLVWTVYDLPEHLQRGDALARQRDVAQLRFTERWSDASGADLLMASGSLHYFSTPLPEMIGTLERLPRYVLVNRTPLTDASTVATIQDAGAFRVACMVYNRQELIDGFERIGYRLVDSWAASELSLEIPGDADHSVAAYTGLFFELSETL